MIAWESAIRANLFAISVSIHQIISPTCQTFWRCIMEHSFINRVPSSLTRDDTRTDLNAWEFDHTESV